MRILEVVPFFSPQMGGSVQAVYHIAKNLGAKGHRVTILAGDYAQHNIRFNDGPFDVVPLPDHFGGQGFYITPGIFRWAEKHITEYDVIHLHLTRTFQNVVMHDLAMRYQVPYVITAHGTFPRLDRMKTVKWIYDLIWGRIIYKHAKCWIAVTPPEADQFRNGGIPNKRIRIVGYGLDLEEFKSLPSPGIFRRTLPGITKNTTILMATCRLHRTKGIDFLIEGFSRLQMDREAYRLVIVGPDEGELQRLKSLARKCGVENFVVFAGPLYGVDRLKAFVDADIFLSTSHFEVTGLNCFEALMCGAPVIVTKNTGQGILIEEAQAGYLVPFGDTASLKSQILNVTEDRNEALRRVRAGQKYIREQMDWRRKTDELIGVYREIIPESDDKAPG